MKSFTLALSLLAVAAGASALAARAGLEDGVYVVTVDESGNQTTEFTPYREVMKRAGGAKGARSALERRRSGCGPGSGNRDDIIAAQDGLKAIFPDDPMYLSKNGWTYVSSRPLPLSLPAARPALTPSP